MSRLEKSGEEYFLDGLLLEHGDELEVDVPMVGTVRGRFQCATPQSLPLVRWGEGWRVARLDTDLVEVRWPKEARP